MVARSAYAQLEYSPLILAGTLVVLVMRMLGEMAALGNGRTVLVRATFPLGGLSSGKPQSLTVTPLGSDARSFTATQIWDAPSDPAIPGRSFYLLLDGSGLLDLEPALRDAVVLELPLSPLCEEGCEGLCVECGQRLDDLPAGHSHEQLDPRWAALAAMKDGLDAPSS